MTSADPNRLAAELSWQMAARGGCTHASAVPVESVVTGEVLAALCLGCDAQLSPA